jgi:hypothetical protein
VRRAAAVAGLAVALVLVACGSGAPTPALGPVETGSLGAPSSGGTVGLISPVVGVPVDIEAEGFTKVTAFTIRTDTGEQLRLLMGTLENGAEFPPNHLAEHLAGSTRVRAFFRGEGVDRVVYRLEDADPVR